MGKLIEIILESEFDKPDNELISSIQYIFSKPCHYRAVSIKTLVGQGTSPIVVECPDCKGAGYLWGTGFGYVAQVLCQTCKGTGRKS